MAIQVVKSIAYGRLLTAAGLLWLAGLWCCSGQDYIFDVDIINVEDGLPHRNTYGIVQDKEGFIWVSTLAGISRYDGYRFKNYDLEALGLSQSHVAYYLAVDGDNRIWYATNMNRSLFIQSGFIDSSRDSIYGMESISGGRFSAKDVVYVGNPKPGRDEVIIATEAGVVYSYNGISGKSTGLPTAFPKRLSLFLTVKPWRMAVTGSASTGKSSG